MENTIAMMSDISVILFDLLVYTRLITLYKDKKSIKTIMWTGCAVIFAVYLSAVYVFSAPASAASFLFMTLPSFIFFYILSKHKDARFIVTFCFIDTITLAFAFFSRTLLLVYGKTGGIIGVVALVTLLVWMYIKAKPLFLKYRMLLDKVQDGWGFMTVSSVMIYLLMIYSAAYPKPLAERQEYLPVYALLSITVISFYAVFVVSIVQKSKLYELNYKLKEEMKWHGIAYTDALTGIQNRMAYIEYINRIYKFADKNRRMFAVMIDVDNFKRVNDTYGHHAGDETLIRISKILDRAFCKKEYYSLFRIGGDEFAVLAIDVEEKELVRTIAKAESEDAGYDCEISCGYAKVDMTKNNAIEDAFDEADGKMYDKKASKKLC